MTASGTRDRAVELRITALRWTVEVMGPEPLLGLALLAGNAALLAGIWMAVRAASRRSDDGDR